MTEFQSTLQEQVTGLNTQIGDAATACKLQVSAVKAEARKGKFKAFLYGLGAGFGGGYSNCSKVPLGYIVLLSYSWPSVKYQIVMERQTYLEQLKGCADLITKDFIDMETQNYLSGRLGRGRELYAR